MTTWPDLLAEIREDLVDTGDKPRWADSLLHLYLRDALADYSMWFPRRIDRVELERSGEAYTLPSDFVSALLVECPKDRYLEERVARPGVRFSQRSGKPTTFYVDGGGLYLAGHPLDGDGVLLTYHASHPAPAIDHSVLVMSKRALTESEQSITTGFKSFDEPQVLLLRSYGADAEGDVVIAGADADDEPLEETIALVPNEEVYGTEVFATVTGVTLPALEATVPPEPAKSGDVSIGLAPVDLTLPAVDEELLRIYIKAKAHEQMRGRTAALDRFKTRATAGGDRTDNPIAPEVGSLMDDYYRKVAERLGGSAIMLYRPGRGR